MSVAQAKAFCEVVTSNTILGNSLVEKIRALNPSPSEIEDNAVVAIAKEAIFSFTADDFHDAVYGPAGKGPWDLADIWVDEAIDFIYADNFISNDKLVAVDEPNRNSGWTLGSHTDDCTW